jgi:hypothetical protein
MSGTVDAGQSEGASIILPNSPGISSTTNTTAGANVLTIPFTLQSGSPDRPDGNLLCGRSGGCNKNQVVSFARQVYELIFV